MRHRRMIFLTTLTACAVASPLGGGIANATSPGSSSTSTAVTDKKPPCGTACEVPVTQTPKPPVTETPKPPVTEMPKPPATNVSKPPVTGLPSTTPVMTTPLPETPGVTPTTPGTRTPTDVVNRAPGGGGQLPFTGPGDVVLAVVLALLAGTGGILFLAGAAGREQLDAAQRRTMDSPSGFQLAYRELRKQQMDE